MSSLGGKPAKVEEENCVWSEWIAENRWAEGIDNVWQLREIPRVLGWNRATHLAQTATKSHRGMGQIDQRRKPRVYPQFGTP